MSRAAFLRFVTGKNDNFGCVTGRNFVKIRGKIELLCHGCHGLRFFGLSRARKGVTGNFFRTLSRVKIRVSREKKNTVREGLRFQQYFPIRVELY